VPEPWDVREQQRGHHYSAQQNRAERRHETSGKQAAPYRLARCRSEHVWKTWTKVHRLHPLRGCLRSRPTNPAEDPMRTPEELVRGVPHEEQSDDEAKCEQADAHSLLPSLKSRTRTGEPVPPAILSGMARKSPVVGTFDSPRNP